MAAVKNARAWQIICLRFRSRHAWLIAIVIAILIILQFRVEQYLFFHESWLQWSDQGHYLDAAHAWASLDLNPARHHYPPGYALMGVPFLALLPQQPFLIPDLACAAISLLLFTRICEYLAPGMRTARLAGAICFLLESSGSSTLRAVWAQPWTTTAACPFLLAIILLALRFSDTKAASRVMRNAAAMGLAIGLAAAIRPSDAALLALSCGCFAGFELLQKGFPWKVLVRITAAGCAGLGLGLLPLGIAHVAIFGLHASDYLGHSAALGFEWRLIPMQWVLLVIGPRPLLPEGTGMEAAFFWIWPGLAGMVACIFARGPARRANALAASAIIAYWLLYLSYRDMHPYGLWRFYNVHYFKWTFPFLAFWSWLLVCKLANAPTRPIAAISLAASMFLFTWRPEFQPVQTGEAAPAGANAITIPAELNSIDSAIMIQAYGSWRDLYYTRPASLRIAGEIRPGLGDAKLFPGPGGGILVPLRLLPDGDITITLPAPAGFPAHAAWQSGRQRIVFGLPCLLTPHRGVCRPDAGMAWQWLQGPHTLLPSPLR